MQDDKLTTKYVPKKDAREYSVFSEEYFSGVDVSLYLDGEKITQVNSLQYSIQEQLKPLYGYASRTFDDMAIGNRIVIGSFKVPISNPEENMKFSDLTIASPKVEENYITEIPMPSWTSTVKKYGDVKYVNQGEQYKDPSNTNQSNIPVVNKPNTSSVVSDLLSYSKEVLAAQKELLKLSYNIDITGIMDIKTKYAIKSFQESLSINITGLLDDETKSYLLGKTSDEKDIHYGLIIDNNAALRIGPGPEFNIITSELPLHTKVQIIDEDGIWYKVKLNNNKKGFVAKSFISMIKY